MSTTNLEKSIPTYLANNSSYNATTVTFDVNLPSPSGFTYEFGTAFNISKNCGGTIGEVSAICLFMKKNIANEIVLSSTASIKQTFNLNISTLIDYYDSKAIPFDDKKPTACIILIHNHSFSLDLVDACFHSLESHITGLTTASSPRIITVAKKSSPVFFIPRKLGVSIIKR